MRSSHARGGDEQKTKKKQIYKMVISAVEKNKAGKGLWGAGRPNLDDIGLHKKELWS